MIGYIDGTVIFSDGNEMIIQTASGVGYQIFSSRILPEGNKTALYLSQIIRETSQDLYGFSSLKEKKIFELLLGVKGVGPKSAFALMGTLGVEQILNAIRFEDKKVLTSAPGIGAKAASQLILDLQSKIQKLIIYSSDEYCGKEEKISAKGAGQDSIVGDTLLACRELGFDEGRVLPIIRELMSKVEITKAEQLVHLVLKEV